MEILLILVLFCMFLVLAFSLPQWDIYRLFWGTRNSTIKLTDSVFHFSAHFSSTRCQIWIFSKSDHSGAMMNVSIRAPGGISAYTCFG